MSNVEVRESKIEGKGVFALKDFKKGELILDIDDTQVITDPGTLSQYQKDYECDWLENGKIILMKEPEKHINHSCDPNTYVKTIDGIRKVIAMHNIKKGEEINYDYAINGYYNSDIPCHCGGKNCRGTISPNFFKLSRERQLEYLPYLDEWFVNKFKKELSLIKTS